MRTARWSPGAVRMTPHPGGRPEPGPPRPSDAEVRAIAAQLVRELRKPPADNPGDRLMAQRHELAPADEEGVDAAVADLLAVDPESTMRAHREAAGEPEPRPWSWALGGGPPERAQDTRRRGGAPPRGPAPRETSADGVSAPRSRPGARRARQSPRRGR